MIKLYTDKDYADKAVEANQTGQKLYIHTYTEEAERPQLEETNENNEEGITEEFAELLIAPDNYYICYKDNYTDGTINENYEQSTIERLKAQKTAENTAKAKEAIENGFVVYKNAQFETNAQTVGDLTATMLLMQAGGFETYTWLSKDDIEVELTIEDIGTLGGLIAAFKGNIWQNKYVGYKSAIEQAETIEEVEEIIIDYEAEIDN